MFRIIRCIGDDKYIWDNTSDKVFGIEAEIKVDIRG